MREKWDYAIVILKNASLTVGVILVVLSFVDHALIFDFGTPGWRWVLAPAGGILLVIGLIQHARRDIGVLGHTDFWKSVFDAMPPAFIKEYSEDGYRYEHIRRNAAVVAIEGEFEPGDTKDDFEHHRIVRDHALGDKYAKDKGSSRMIELCDLSGGRPPVQIFTVKKAVTHAGKRYIVGWYLPIAVEGDISDEKTAIQQTYGLPLMRMVPVEPGQKGLSVNVGKAVNALSAAGEGPMPLSA